MVKEFFSKKNNLVVFDSASFLYLQPQNVLLSFFNAKVAQLVERNLAKVEVAGSRPVFRSLAATT